VKDKSSVINSSEENKRKPFFTSDPCDLDLLPEEHKINRWETIIYKSDQSDLDLCSS